MSKFTANDVIEFAIAIERNGERFYRLAQERVQDDQVQKMFRRLASDEVAHGRLFEKLRASIDAYDPGDEFPEEYFAYLHAFVEQIVFSDAKLDEAVAAAKDSLSAVRFAKQREQDAIQFYGEMRNLVPEADRALLDDLIAEERSHFTQLAELEKEMTGS